MSKILVYRLTPKAGERAALVREMQALGRALSDVPGAMGSELLVALDSAGPVLLIERWASEEAHAASSGSLPPGIFKTIMQYVEGKPDILACQPVDDAA